MDAEQRLAELKKLSTAMLKQTKIAARNEGLVLVDSTKFGLLEALCARLKTAMETARMTRDYKDVIEEDGDTYNGKRYLFRRQEFNEVIRFLNALEKNVNLPFGCFADDK